MADLYDLLGGDDSDAQSQAQALAAALRRQQAVGMLGQLTGNKVIGGMGGDLASDAQKQQAMLAQVPEVRQKLMLQRQQQQNAAQDYQKQAADMAEASAARASARDPNSTRTRLNLGLAKQFGVKVPEGATAADVDDKVLGFAAHLAGLKEQAAGRHDQRAASLSAKEESDLEKQERLMAEALDPTKARGGVLADRQKRLDASQRLRKLITDPTNAVRDLNTQEQQEAATTFQSMLSPGGHSEAEVRGLVPKSLVGDANGILQWIRNAPTGTGQQAFTQRMLQSLDREEGLVKGQVKEAQVQRLAGYGGLKTRAPERFKRVLLSAGLDPDEVDENGRYKPRDPTGGTSMVKVISPENVHGQIPAANLAAALTRGFRRAP